MRNALADTYDVAARDPDIQVVDVDLLGDRKLILRHKRRNGVPLAEGDRDRVMRHVKRLWGYDAALQEEDAELGGAPRAFISSVPVSSPRPSAAPRRRPNCAAPCPRRSACARGSRHVRRPPILRSPS